MANQKYDAFLTVARLGSFKAAAEELGYTQAGISYLVNALEKELGLTLFLREYGGVHLTTEGREVLGLVQAINADEHALATRVRELADREGGLVRVGAFTSVAIEWFPSIARAFLDQYPKIDLKLLCIDDEEELVNAVWEGRADCAFSIAPRAAQPGGGAAAHRPAACGAAAGPSPRGRPLLPHRSLSPRALRAAAGQRAPLRDGGAVRGQRGHPQRALHGGLRLRRHVHVSAGLGFSVLPSLILSRPLFPLAVLPAERECSRSISLGRPLARHRLGRHPRLRRSHPRMGRRALRELAPTSEMHT